MKNQMRLSRLIAYLAMPILIVSVIVSCTKESKPASETLVKNNSFANAAKEFYLSQIAIEQADSKESGSKKINQQRYDETGRLAEVSEKIAWQKATIFNQRQLEFLLVPFTDNKPFNNKNYEFLRTIVFSRDPSGINMNIIEILGDKGETFGDHNSNLMNSAIRKLLLDQLAPIKGINASVILFDKQYQQTKSFHISNGIWEAKRIQFRSDLEITQ